MGGKALKKTKTRRLDRDEYIGVERAAVALVSKFATSTGVPRYFDTKSSFGDLDVVYSSPDPNRVISEAMRAFRSRERVKNGHVTSIDYQFGDDLDAFRSI